MEDINTAKLRKEMEQLFNLTRQLSRCFIILSFIYLVHTIIAYVSLDEHVFKDYFANSDYAKEMYHLTHTAILVNMAHAMTLMSLGIFVTCTVRKFQILNTKHYKQLGCLTVMITIIYFLPIAILSYKAWSDATKSELNSHKGALRRFMGMVFYLMNKSEQGVWGILFSTIIHFCLYLLVFAMLWCTY